MLLPCKIDRAARMLRQDAPRHDGVQRCVERTSRLSVFRAVIRRYGAGEARGKSRRGEAARREVPRQARCRQRRCRRCQTLKMPAMLFVAAGQLAADIAAAAI